MTDPRELIERLVSQLSGVERDTHYDIHDGDYCIPHGMTKPAYWQTDPCECALCAGRKYLENGGSDD